MFTRRLRLCKCWEVSYASKVAFQEGEVFFYSQNGTRWGLGKCYWQQGAARVHASSGSCSLYDVLSYRSRQIFSWRKGNISRVHQLSVPLGCSQQPSASAPCITIVSINQRKQRCKTKVYSFFCLLTRDPGNRGLQRKREESASCRSRVRLWFRFTHLGTDQQNAKDQTS